MLERASDGLLVCEDQPMPNRFQIGRSRHYELLSERLGGALLSLLVLVVILANPGPGSGQGPIAAPSTNTASASTPQANPYEYVISPDDLLDINVFDVAQLSRTYRVSPSGSIALALLPEPIAAAGLTPGQLSQAIEEKLRTTGLVSNPQVTVEVKESRVHAVTVAGAVKRPQIYPVFGRTTLLDVLSQAEGLADDAGNMATIIRGEVAMRMLGAAGNGTQAGPPRAPARIVKVDLNRVLETGNPALNLDVYPGDRVTVQRAGIVYVVGAVNRPGGFPLRSDLEEMTVLKAIALAQDLKSTAIRGKAVIMRKNPQAPKGREELPVDLKQVLAGRTPDPQMQPNDILFVPDSTGKKALRRAAEAAVQITTGIIIWHR